MLHDLMYDLSTELCMWSSVLPIDSLFDVQGTLRDLSKGGRNLSMDQIEPV